MTALSWALLALAAAGLAFGLWQWVSRRRTLRRLNAMLDYMQALRERFVGECDRERRQAIHNLRKEISQGIRKEYRRKLLRLVDLEAALREEYEEKKRQMEAAERRAEQAGTVTGERGGGAQQDYAGESVEDTEEEDREEQAELSAGGFLKGGAAGMLVGVIGLFWAGFVNGRSSFTGITPITFFAALILAVGIVLTAAGVRALIRERKEEKEYRREGEQSTGGKTDARPEQTGTAEAPAAVQQDADAEIRRLRWEMDRIRSEWKEKQIRRDNLKEQADEIMPGEEERSLEIRRKALILADLPALLDGADAILSEDAVDLVDSSLVAFKQSHFPCPPLNYSWRGSMYLAAPSNWP